MAKGLRTLITSPLKRSRHAKELKELQHDESSRLDTPSPILVNELLFQAKINLKSTNFNVQLDEKIIGNIVLKTIDEHRNLPCELMHSGFVKMAWEDRLEYKILG